MSSIVIIRLLKTSILLGLCLIVTGHGLIVSSYFTNQYGIKGIITAAACIAIGVLLSLPTKRQNPSGSACLVLMLRYHLFMGSNHTT